MSSIRDTIAYFYILWPGVRHFEHHPFLSIAQHHRAVFVQLHRHKRTDVHTE